MLLHLTRKERDDKYDLNQLRIEPWIPNQDERRVSKMLCAANAVRCPYVTYVSRYVRNGGPGQLRSE